MSRLSRTHSWTSANFLAIKKGKISKKLEIVCTIRKVHKKVGGKNLMKF